MKEYLAALAALGAAAVEVMRRPWGFALYALLLAGGALGGFESQEQLHLGMGLMFAAVCAFFGLMVSLEREFASVKGAR